jgi:putative ABC transport system permease protein
MKRSQMLLRQWTRRPGRALATIASVAVAVGAVVATWVSANASRTGYRSLTETVEGIQSVDVAARGGGRFEAKTLPSLGTVNGVRAVVPLFYRPTLLRVGERRLREVAVGVAAETLTDLGLMKLTAGRPCIGFNEVVLESSFAESLGLSLDDELLFFARKGIDRMKVVGLVERDSMAWFAETSSVIVDIRVLGEMSRAFGLLDRARVVLKPEANRKSVLHAIRERLPEELLAEIPAGRASMAEDVLHSADLGLDFVTGLTVAMAWFIVGNAMLMNVTERRRGFSLIRLLGATGKQVRRMVILEAALLGLIGALVGAGLGLAAAGPIAAGISRALQAPPGEHLFVQPVVLPVSIGLGMLVAMAAAWWPAQEATDVDLLDGLATAPQPPARSTPWKFIVAVGMLTLLAIGNQALVLAEILPPRASVPGGMILLLAFVATTPILLPPITRLLALLVPRRYSVETTLAVEQILRQPVRTALTTGVLVVAVTNGIGLGHAIRDNVDDVLGWYARMMRADWVLTRAGMISPAGNQDDTDGGSAEAEARSLEGIARVEGIGLATGRVAGSACVVVARDFTASEPLPLEPVGMSEEALREALERGAVAAGTVLARRTGLAPGDSVAVEVFGRTTTVEVAGLVVDYTSGGASLHINREAARRLFGMDAADVLLITAADGAVNALRDPLSHIADEHSLLLRSFSEIRGIVDRIVQGVVGSLWAILGLGFVVGSLGVANTVTMNVLEKRRTLGLLRAVGMTRGQVTRMVVIESLLLGAAGGLIGLAGGITTALFIQLASQPLLGHPIKASFRPDVVAMNLLAAVAITAIAAWLPARRAARLDLLESIAAE